MTHGFTWVLAAAGLPFLAASLYLLALTLLWRRPALLPARDARLSFCILVPAHNEAGGITGTIRSLQALDYPEALRNIVVVADNCTDDTAGAAAAANAHVIVRADSERRGKGWALQYAIDTLLDPSNALPHWDALVVIDADTVVSPNLLRTMAAHLEAGALAVQAAYLPARGGNGPLAVITDVAFTAFHHVRSGGRERLGLSCGLRGNGMAFRRSLLRDVPHAAFSRTEDLEFGVLLGLRGIRVAFAGQTAVYGEMPEHRAVAARQRERWIGGRAAIARRFAWPLLVDAVRRRSLIPADLAIDLLIAPLSVLALASMAGLAASLMLSAATGAFTVSTAVWAVACAGLAIHVGHAARLAGQGRAFLRAARTLPGYAIGKALITFRSLRPSEETWVRTTRAGEQP